MAATTSTQRRRIELLIAGDPGYDQMIREAMALSTEQAARAVVMFGAETFAFRPRPSTILVPHMPAGVIACVPALEEFGIASRLASPAGLPGCFEGTATELAEQWLDALEPETLQDIHITACGDAGLRNAIKQLGTRFNLPTSA